MAWHSPEESPFGRSGPDHLHPLSSFQRDPAAGKKGESILAGAVKAAAKVAQQPDGWLAKRQLWSTGALISQPLIPNTSVAAWVLVTPLWLNPEFSYSSHKKNKEKKKNQHLFDKFMWSCANGSSKPSTSMDSAFDILSKLMCQCQMKSAHLFLSGVTV